VALSPEVGKIGLERHEFFFSGSIMRSGNSAQRGYNGSVIKETFSNPAKVLLLGAA
jgi:hypothetical protein